MKTRALRSPVQLRLRLWPYVRRRRRRPGFDDFQRLVRLLRLQQTFSRKKRAAEKNESEKKAKTLTINLSGNRFDQGRESLGELLEQAVAITFPAAAEYGYKRNQAAWLARWAIRAVCEEVIRTGAITLP